MKIELGMDTKLDTKPLWSFLTALLAELKDNKRQLMSVEGNIAVDRIVIADCRRNYNLIIFDNKAPEQVTPLSKIAKCAWAPDSIICLEDFLGICSIRIVDFVASLNAGLSDTQVLRLPERGLNIGDKSQMWGFVLKELKQVPWPFVEKVSELRSDKIPGRFVAAHTVKLTDGNFVGGGIPRDIAVDWATRVWDVTDIEYQDGVWNFKSLGGYCCGVGYWKNKLVLVSKTTSPGILNILTKKEIDKHYPRKNNEPVQSNKVEERTSKALS